MGMDSIYRSTYTNCRTPSYHLWDDAAARILEEGNTPPASPATAPGGAAVYTLSKLLTHNGLN